MQATRPISHKDIISLYYPAWLQGELRTAVFRYLKCLIIASDFHVHLVTAASKQNFHLKTMLTVVGTVTASTTCINVFKLK